jgi:hypothetical protein
MIMLSPSRRTRAERSRAATRPRRGMALVFVLIFVTAMAALAMSSIFMASNANLLAKSYDREHDLKFAAEAALAIGKSRVNTDPLVLALPVGQSYDTLLLAQTITGADGKVLPGIKVNVYAGPTGSTSGQFGRFSSIVAEARDQRGNGFIRRLELTQESFAKFAYWSDDESNGSTTIFFNNGDELWGPVWSNDTIHIGSGGATFHDEVGTAAVVSGASYGIFSKGKKENQKVIQLPSNSVLTQLSGYASLGGFSYNPGTNGSETSVVERIEFVAVDLNNANDSTDSNEGFFRVYDAKPGNAKYLRGDWPANGGNVPTVSQVEFCGDWHWAPNANGGGQQFYPASVHSSAWFQTQLKQGYIDHYGWTAKTASDSAVAESTNTLKGILDNPAARCFLAGDPHLVAVDRSTGLGYTLPNIERGGTDTTFTPIGLYGAWKSRGTAAAVVSTKRPWDATYLYPIDRGFNSGSKGVIYASGTIGLSGTLNGRITLYANGNVVLLDDLRYANDPVKGVCRDILGIISDKDVVIADNALNTPPEVSATKKTSTYFSLDDTKDLYLHAVIMALGTSFRAENYGSGPTDVNDCNGVNNGRGCIYLSGGIIQDKRGPVGTSAGTGFAKRYTYDRCAVVNPPPYFPTTGRFLDNRYIELDPAGFVPLTYFQSLTPDP